jgi:hypothetical protein
VLPDGAFELIVNLQEILRKLFHDVGSTVLQCIRAGLDFWRALELPDYRRPAAVLNDRYPLQARRRRCFSGMPADELAGQVVELNAVWGFAIWHWRDQLLAACTPDSKFHILERLLESETCSG